MLFPALWMGRHGRSVSRTRVCCDQRSWCALIMVVVNPKWTSSESSMYEVYSALLCCTPASRAAAALLFVNFVSDIRHSVRVSSLYLIHRLFST